MLEKLVNTNFTGFELINGTFEYSRFCLGLCFDVNDRGFNILGGLFLSLPVIIYSVAGRTPNLERLCQVDYR